MNTEHTNQSTAPEPFGYFKAEPFGWTDCEKDVDVSVHDGKVVHYDNGPNLAEALARLASRVAKVRNLPAPTITAQPPAVAVPLSAALADIAAERRRQIEAEGWTPEHDDAHSDGQMATAAACYAISAHNVIRYKRITMPSWWPWDSKWWKPGTTRRDLVKAGALIAAEIERIDRAAQKGGA